MQELFGARYTGALLMRFRVLAIALASGVAALPAAAQPAYTSRCAEIVLDSAGYLRRTAHPVTGAAMTIISQGFIGRCPADQIRLRADSAERHEETGVTMLFGNVQYTEPGRILHSDRLFYYSQTEYITAEGNVRGTMDGGTSMQGPRAEYWRESAALGRPRARFVATGRPRFTVVEAEATGARAEPTRIDADRVFMDGDSLIYASGSVVVDRPDLRTRSDSVFVDRGRDIVNLRGREPPHVEGKGDRRFTLTGSLIDLYSRDRDLERVVSAGAATVVSDDFTITSDTLDMRIVDERLSRAFAWGPSRARAVSPDRLIEADSLDVDMPSGGYERFSQSVPPIAESAVDTAVIRSDERDWIRGDTITARFDSLAVGDTTSTPKIKSLVARLNARAFYQVAPGTATRQDPRSTT
jgi:lipopolysaccharide export system protein LptA